MDKNENKKKATSNILLFLNESRAINLSVWDTWSLPFESALFIFKHNINRLYSIYVLNVVVALFGCLHDAIAMPCQFEISDILICYVCVLLQRFIYIVYFKYFLRNSFVIFNLTYNFFFNVDKNILSFIYNTRCSIKVCKARMSN